MSVATCDRCSTYVDTDYSDSFYIDLPAHHAVGLCPSCREEIPEWFLDLIEKQSDEYYVMRGKR